MIFTIVRIGLLRLWHNKAEMVLLFVVPIAFFSVFALIFGSRESGSSAPKIRVALCDEVADPFSEATLSQLNNQASFRIYEPLENLKEKQATWSRSSAERLVRNGTVSAAIILTRKSNTTKSDSLSSAQNRSQADIRVQLYSDSYDQVATQVVSALIQRSVLTAQAEVQSKLNRPMTAGINDQTEPSLGSTNEVVRATFSANIPIESQSASSPLEGGLLPEIEMIDVLGEEKANPAVSMYAAGIAVMFLLFSATSASGSLLEERENSTLERLLSSQLTLDQLLMGKWCYMVIIGCGQMTVMFIWAQLMFGVDLVGHIDGFIIMTVTTVAAASSFALMLATLCRTRLQLNWLSIVVILTMSALGGSMVPRYLMSEQMQQIGLATFNAWALDGFNKIFWRDLPVSAISVEIGVLATCALIFITIARILAIRWERI